MGIQQGDGTVLHLSSRIALGMDVADLFEFESTLKGDGVIDAATEKNHVLGFGKAMGQGFRALIMQRHQLLQLLGKLAQFSNQRLDVYC